MATIVLPLVVTVLGILVYLLAANPKAQEMGKIAYFVGLLVLVAALGTKQLHF